MDRKWYVIQMPEGELYGPFDTDTEAEAWIDICDKERKFQWIVTTPSPVGE